MGTRFVATVEARASVAYKQALAAATPEGTMLIKRSIGQPGRVLASRHAQRIVAAEERGEDIVSLISGAANARGVEDGDLVESYVWAGQCVGLIEDVLPAGDVVRLIVAEAGVRLRALWASGFSQD